MRFGFVTCVQLGLSCMEEIYRIGGQLDLVITLEDDQARSKSGRVYLDTFCDENEIELVKSRDVNDNKVVKAIQAKKIDWLFIIGWSQIARDGILSAPNRGVLGMHPTLLPIGRGRAAVPWAILKDLPETGVTLFKLDEGVDTGPILAQMQIPLLPRETAATLYQKVDITHQKLISTVWPRLVNDTIELRTQDESKATEWPGRRPEDGEIFREMTVLDVDRLVRAVTRPYPGAFIKLKGGRLRVWKGEPVGNTSPPDDEHVLEFADGLFMVQDADWETDEE